MTNTNQATWIKFFALLTAIPRWTGALLAAEGFEIPEAWLGLWIPLSALLAMGMAVTEAWAFSYVFSAWRNQTDKRASRLLAMAVFSAIVFVFVLAPYIGARVRGVSLNEILGHWVIFWLWSIAVAASTITIIIPVGYAQKDQRRMPARSASAKPAPAKRIEPCWCGKELGSPQARSAHSKKHKNELAGISSVPQALALMAEIYPGQMIKPAEIRQLMTKGAPDVQEITELS